MARIVGAHFNRASQCVDRGARENQIMPAQNVVDIDAGTGSTSIFGILRAALRTSGRPRRRR